MVNVVCEARAVDDNMGDFLSRESIAIKDTISIPLNYVVHANH